MSPIDLDDQRARGVFFDIYEGIPRGGPGSTASTIRALELARPLPSRCSILDIGCGPGRQTLALAGQLTDAEIIAIDLHQPFLDSLASELAARGLDRRVRTMRADMSSLDFAPGSFDLIWCEGAAYFIGLENALRSWKTLLQAGGALALTEATWLKTDPPEPVLGCWRDEYPEMRDTPTCLDLFTECGYQVLGHFHLPESDWWNDFYTPMEARISALKESYAGDPVAEEVLAASQDEIEIYRRYSEYYGYTFFIVRPAEE
jgi:SAM-dependent methyltransferase